jgi:hypothetical protein
MFLGHFGLAMAAKRIAPRVSLGTTFLAAQFLDALWPLFVLAGIESFEIVPGVTKVNPLDFTSYPWSHSLAMAIVWGVLFAAVYGLVRKRPRDAAIVGALVVSHWLLDWVVHRPDLALFPGDHGRHGMGLWNSLEGSLAIELALFILGIVIFLRSSHARDRIGAVGFGVLVAFLAASYLAATFGPLPPSTTAVASTALIGWLIFAFAWWIDRHREPTAR